MKESTKIILILICLIIAYILTHCFEQNYIRNQAIEKNNQNNIKLIDNL